IRATLADSLGADPGAALRERHLRLLRAPEPVEPAEPPPSNLPAPLTSFIGRDDDLARIESLLAVGRLVTVVGPGGAGKTRLAVEAARRHRHEYRDGAWLVDLAAVTEPAKVGAAVLATVGLRGTALFEGSGRMRDEGGEVDVLADQFNGRESLLLVDNCEHLIDAVAELIAALLPRCAGLRVLATSREALAIDGEALVPLGPLALPGPEAGLDEIRRASAVRMFTDRAAAVRPGFDVDADTVDDILRVVRGLDGIPLALELAAARLRTLSLTELADGLSDRFRLLGTGSRTAYARHRTLGAVIDWSWKLLGEPERTVAERVSVLPGGVTVASATAVCAGTPVPAADIPELLASLVDRSLLQLAPDSGRYRMLETLREYGIDRLAEQGTLDTARGLAARHLSELMARHEPQLRNRGQLEALRVMTAEYDNAIAALRHLCDGRDAAGAVALVLNLCWYWQMFGRNSDASYWLTETLALPGGEDTFDRDVARAMLLLNRLDGEPQTPHHRDPALRALVDRLMAYPSLPGLAGALTALLLFFVDEREASLALLKRLIDGPDVWLSGLARLFRSQFAENAGDLGQVRVDVAGALESFGQVGDRWGLATALPMRALVRQYDGDLDGAQADLRRARALAREFGSLSLNDEIFIDLRWIDLCVRQGDIDGAIAVMNAAREKAERSATPEMLILIDALEATVRIRIGDTELGLVLIERAEAAMAEKFKSPFTGDHGRALIGAARALLCLESGDGPGAEAALARAYAAALETHDMPMVAMVAVAAASLADFYGRHRDAAVLLGAAARLRGAHDRTDPQIRKLSSRCRDAVGEDVFSAAYQSGWELDGKTASARVDPARLLSAALPAADDQARRA
ncbi:AfsR/SARP family transcriptional regulator, partial [Actinoplanes sp. NPDC051633]|uniref:ATP-binding protein n=1 Tax=Actinoplanes sp. NPDC051633 TaxID=3155670 RepID=UPI0034311490